MPLACRRRACFAINLQVWKTLLPFAYYRLSRSKGASNPLEDPVLPPVREVLGTDARNFM